jgi:hypothetical protein
MSRRISIRRIFSLTVATSLLGGAAYCGLQWHRLHREFQSWIDARPLTTTIDLSRPGTVTAPLHQTCDMSHGEAFMLTVSAGGDHEQPQPLKDLEGTITIKNAAGEDVESLEMAQIINDHGLDQPIMLVYFHPFPVGEYTATITVIHGAEALSGADQTVHVEYLLCGLEQLPQLFAGGLTFVLALPGLIVATLTTIGVTRHGFTVVPKVSISDKPDITR